MPCRWRWTKLNVVTRTPWANRFFLDTKDVSSAKGSPALLHCLMPLEEIVSFIKKAPGKVIANHMDALNHCSISRSKLNKELEKNGLLYKTLVPKDGETITIDEVWKNHPQSVDHGIGRLWGWLRLLRIGYKITCSYIFKIPSLLRVFENNLEQVIL